MLALLALFTAERSELTVEEAAEALNCTLRTTYRYVRSLAAAGLMAPLHGGRYVLGPAAVQMDWVIRNSDPLTKAAGPAIAVLAEAVEVPAVILLCRHYRNQVMCVSQAAAGHPSFASSYQRGRPMPLFQGAASKAILAALPHRAIRALHARQAGEMEACGLGNSLQQVRTALARIRSDGVSITSGELDPGLTGIAAPLPGSDVLPTGSLALVVEDFRLEPEITAGSVRLLRAAAERMAADLRSI